MPRVYRFENTEESAKGISAAIDAGTVDYDYTPGPGGAELDPMYFVIAIEHRSPSLMAPGDYVVELEQPHRVVIVPKDAVEAIAAHREAELAEMARLLATANKPLPKDPGREDARRDVRSGYADPRFRNRDSR